jgi:hypothetical protein
VRLGGGLLDGRLESFADVEDDVGVDDLLHLARRQLEVVRLGAGRCQVRHLDGRAADILGRERERIEAGNDLGRARGAGVAAAGCETRRRE